MPDTTSNHLIFRTETNTPSTKICLLGVYVRYQDSSESHNNPKFFGKTKNDPIYSYKLFKLNNVTVLYLIYYIILSNLNKTYIWHNGGHVCFGHF